MGPWAVAANARKLSATAREGAAPEFSQSHGSLVQELNPVETCHRDHIPRLKLFHWAVEARLFWQATAVRQGNASK